MRSIIERTVSSIVTKRMVLQADELVRPLSIGSNWGRLRIGLRFVLTDSGANGLGTANGLYVGACSGQTWSVMTHNVRHFFGFAKIPASSFNRNAGPPVSYTTLMGRLEVVGSTITNATGLSVALAAMPLDRLSYLIIDLDKFNPAAAFVRAFLPTNTLTGPAALSYEQYLGDFEGTSTFNRTGWSTYTSSTVALNEAANGPLDTLNVAFDYTPVNLEIQSLDVATIRSGY